MEVTIFDKSAVLFVFREGAKFIGPHHWHSDGRAKSFRGAKNDGANTFPGEKMRGQKLLRRKKMTGPALFIRKK